MEGIMPGTPLPTGAGRGATETAQTTPRGGLFAMLALLSKPEAQRSLAFLLAFSEKFQRGVTGA